MKKKSPVSRWVSARGLGVGGKSRLLLSLAVLVSMISALFNVQGVGAAPLLTISMLTWNMVGLDSNNVNVGPNDFPVGARVCNTGDAPATNLATTLTWDSANAYIYFQPGTNTNLTVSSLAAGACTDQYFQVEITRDPLAYYTKRQFHITTTATGGLSVSTPQPRELYVEKLISQNRNSVSDISLSADGSNFTTIGFGGSMNLLVGGTYWIRLTGATATQGYNQLESFMNLPNAVFELLSVSSTYTVGPSPTTRLYADACTWDSDPNSLTYRSCIGANLKAGGGVTNTFKVKILSVPGTNPIGISSLLYDFSGSSFHYNSDFRTTYVYAFVGSPATFSKAFSPNTITANGTSTLTYTISNTSSAAISNVNFADTTGWPSGMTVADTPVVASNCGSPSPSTLTVGATSASFSNITVAASDTCTIAIKVTAAAAGTYNNTTGNLFIGSSDTGQKATAPLVVSALPTGGPSSCSTRTTLATWEFDGGAVGAATSLGANVASATASSSGGTFTGVNAAGLPASPTGYWSGSGWSTTTTPSNTAPYFILTVDGHAYGSLGISYNYYLFDNPDWGGTNNYGIYYAADGANYNNSSTGAATKGSWLTGPSYVSGIGTSSTSSTFRINAWGSAGSNKKPFMYLDHVVITGCAQPKPPTLSKSFSPATIGKGSTSTLSFTVTNPNGSPDNLSLSGINFTDVLPSGLTVADGTFSVCGGTNNLTTTAATGTIKLTTTPTLGAGGTCTFNVTVTGAASGSYQNTTSYVSATESGPNTGAANVGYGSAALTVLVPPFIEKLFGTPLVYTGETTALTFAITNPNPSTSISSLAFTDTLPLGLTVATGTSSQCGGTLTTIHNTSPTPDTISFSGGSLAGGSKCSFSVNVTGAVAGKYTNTTGTVTASASGVALTGNTASDTVTIRSKVSSISLLKQVSLSSDGPWLNFLSVPTPLPQNVYFSFTVENTGDTALTNVRVNDLTMPGLDLSNCTSKLQNGLAQYESITCTAGPVIVSTGGSYSNTANATSTEATSSNSTVRYATAGLLLVKSVAESSFSAAGNTLNYSYLVYNNGATKLAGPVTVADNKVTVTCPNVNTVGNYDTYLDPGEGVTCTATYTILAGDVTAGYVTNTATASAGGTSSNTASATVYGTTTKVADLAIAKSDGVSSLYAGNSTTYTLTVTNFGPDEVSGATVVDTAPTGLTIGSWTCAVTSAGTGGSLTTACGAASGTGNLNTTVTMRNGAVITYTVHASIAPDASGSIANTATVSVPAGTTDPTSGNNSSTDTDTLTQITDLVISKSDGKTTAQAGESINYVISVVNNGPSTAANVVLQDVFPSYLTYQSDTSGITPTQNPTGTYSWVKPTSLAPNATWSFTVVAQAASPLPDGTTTITNSASVSTTTPEADNTNNAASDNDTVTAAAATYPDLVITKTDSKTQVLPGESLTYTITYQNVGTAAATGVVITDQLLNGVTYVSSDPAGVYDDNAKTVTWTIGNLAVDGTHTITITLVSDPAALPGSVAADRVTISDDGTHGSDPNPQNNTSSDSDLVVAPYIVLEKHVATPNGNPAGIAYLNQQLTYTLDWRNAGLATASSVIITDTLPANTTFVSSTNSGTLSGDGKTVTWDLGSQVAGASGSVSFVVTVNAGAGGATQTQTSLSSESGSGSVAVTSSTSPLSLSWCEATQCAAFKGIYQDANGTPPVGYNDNPRMTSFNEGQTTRIALPGTVAVTNGSTTVTGTGTYFTDGVLPGNSVIIASTAYTVSAIASNTSLTLTSAYAGSTASGQTISIDSSWIQPVTPTAGLDLATPTSAPYESVWMNPATLSANWVTVHTPGVTYGNFSFYRQAFCLPLNATGVSASLQIASDDDSVSYLNGISLGEHIGSSSSQTFDGVGGIQSGINMLAIQLLNNRHNGHAAFGGKDHSGILFNLGAAYTGLRPFAYGPGTALAGQELTFTADPNALGGRLPYEYKIDYGDGTSTGYQSSAEFKHTYSNAGTYTATITARAAYGCTGTDQVAVTVLASGKTLLANPAAVTYQDANTKSYSGTSGAGIELDPAADLKIEKTVLSGGTVPGQAVSYQLLVTNLGPNAVTGATIADTLPASITGITWTCSASTGGACGHASGSGSPLSETGDIPSGGTLTYTINGTVAPSTGAGTLLNTATVSDPAGTTDPTPGNNSSTVTTPLAPSVDLSVTKTSVPNPDPAVQGGSITYTITVSNAGPSDAINAAVADTFPGSLYDISWTCVASSGSVCTASGSGNVIDGINLLKDGTATYTATAKIDKYATGTVSNTVTVTPAAGTTDTNLTNNSATANNPLPLLSDLVISKADSGSSVNAGGSTVYTITVTNNGPDEVTNASVTDTAPTGLTIGSWTCAVMTAGTGGTVTTACGAASGTGNLNTTVTMKNGAVITYTVNAALDPTASGTIANTATVNVPPGTTDPAPSNNSNTDTNTITPSLLLSKIGTLDMTVVAPSSQADVGDKINYTLTATNNSGQTLTNVTITDAKLGTLACTPSQPATLVSGATLSCTGSYTLIQADINAGKVDNEATATSTETPSVKAPNEVSLVQTSSMSLVKAGTLDMTVVDPHSRTDVKDKIDYTLTATNTGNTNLTGVQITDAKLGTLSCTPSQPATLTPGGTLVCTGSYTLTQVDIDAGKVNNTASATSGQTSQVDTPKEVTLPQSPSLSLVKAGELVMTVMAPNSRADAGDRVDYTLTATNTGNQTLTSVQITDAKLGTLSCTPEQPATLAPGEALTCTKSYTLSQTDIDAGKVNNTAVATSGQTSQVNTPNEVTLNKVPSLTLTKAGTLDMTVVAPGTQADAGDQIDYTLTATNTGNQTLTSVQITDAKLGTLSCTPTQPAELAPGGTLVCTKTYTLKQSDIDAGKVNNTASAVSDQTDKVDASKEVILTQAPALSLTKDGTINMSVILPNTRADAGDRINYTLTATNTGNQTLTGVAITDAKLGTLSCTPSQPATLSPGGTLSCSGTYTLTQADIEAGKVENTASADSDETPKVDAPNQETLTLVPSLSLTKTGTLVMTVVAPNSRADAGDRVDYTLTATNTGNQTLTGVLITDAKLGTLSCTPSQPATLAPGEALTCSQSYTLLQTDINAGKVNNTAGADSDQTTPVETPKEITLTQVPSLVLTKAGTLDMTIVSPNSRVDEGDKISYSFKVKNTGNVTLTDVNLTADTKITPLPTCTKVDLAPDQEKTLVCTGNIYTVTQADINAGKVENTATVTGKDPANQDVSDSDTVNVPLTKVPALTLTKAGTLVMTVVDPSGQVDAGDRIDYTLTATNTGNQTLTGVAITDAKLGTLSCTPSQPATLTPGGTLICTKSYTLTQTDINSGKVENSATASSDQTTDQTAAKDVTLVQVESLALVKTAAPTTFTKAGDVITYSYTVTNTGNTTLNGPFQVVDDKVTVTCTQPGDGALSPAETMSCTASYTILAGDVTSQRVTNKATATNGTVSSSEVTKSVDLVKLLLSKSASPAFFTKAGDKVTYTYTVENQGYAALTNVTVVDDKISSDGTDLDCGGSSPNKNVIATLAAGATTTCTADYTVTITDETNKGVTNTAVASSGTVTSNESSKTVPLHKLALLKQVSGSPSGPWASTLPGLTEGDPVFYRIRVTNLGLDPAGGLEVTDNKCTLLGPKGDVNANLKLDPDEIWVYTCMMYAEYKTNPTVVENTAQLTDPKVATPLTSQANYTTVQAAPPPPPPQEFDGTGTGTILGYVYHDANNDGKRQAGEDGIPQLIQIKLLDSNGNFVVDKNGNEIVAYTDSSGFYKFLNVPPGNYTVVQVQDPKDYVSTSPNKVPVTVIENGIHEVDFGEYQLPAGMVYNLSGYVWHDANQNQVKDVTEDGIPGVTVILVDQYGTKLNQDLTDDLGAYSFTNLPAGTYSVIELDKTPFVFSTTINYKWTTLGPAALAKAEDPYALAAVAFKGLTTQPALKAADGNGQLNFGDYAPKSDCEFGADPLVDTQAGSYPETTSVGGPYFMQFQVGNNGNLDATDVKISLNVPAYLTITSVNVEYRSINGLGVDKGYLVTQTGNTIQITFNQINLNDVYNVKISTLVSSTPPSSLNSLVVNLDSFGELAGGAKCGNDQGNDSGSFQLSVSGLPTTLPKTGFAPNKITSLPPIPAEKAYNSTDVRLEVPGLNVNIPIVGVPTTQDGWDVTWLNGQAGWLSGTAFPTTPGNSVVSAHEVLFNGQPGPFTNLDTLQWGSQVIIHAFGQKYIYEVRTVSQILPNDISKVMSSENGSWLTLLTCKGYDIQTDSYRYRIMIKAVLDKVVAD